MNHLVNSVQTEFDIEGLEKENKKLISENQKLTFQRQITLTHRDYELLTFILEMKFCSVDEAHRKFYRIKLVDGTLNGQTYAIKRLGHLEREGYLNSTKAFDASKRLFYGTQKAFLMLTNLFPDRPICRPSKNIDGRTVVHDYYVLKTRLILEERKKANIWMSDRHLKLNPGYYTNFDNGNNPDGIYTNQDGVFAFELEVALKSKARYQDKIKKYVEFIRLNDKSEDVFKKVHFIVFTDFTFKHLTEFTAIYKNFFIIEKASSYGLVNGVLK